MSYRLGWVRLALRLVHVDLVFISGLSLNLLNCTMNCVSITIFRYMKAVRRPITTEDAVTHSWITGQLYSVQGISLKCMPTWEEEFQKVFGGYKGRNNCL